MARSLRLPATLTILDETRTPDLRLRCDRCGQVFVYANAPDALDADGDTDAFVFRAWLDRILRELRTTHRC